MVPGKTSLISTVVASMCILVYIAAIVFGAVQITISINNRRVLAEQEFNDLADRASSAAFLGFMSQQYQETLMDTILDSKTILGAIISGSDGQYGFERREGSVINWVGNSPRFKTGFGMPADPFHRGININGQRNGNIQVQYSLIDYDVFLEALKNSMSVILAALAFAVLFLIFEIFMKKRRPAVQYVPEQPMQKPVEIYQAEPVTYENIDIDDVVPEPIVPEPEVVEESTPPASVPQPASVPEPVQEETKPQGLFSPRSTVGWESYTKERLASELHRCAASEHDLVFLCLEYHGEENPMSEIPVIRELAHETVKFFGLRDLIFEMGEKGLSVIIPSVDLDQGIMKSEEFLRRIKSRVNGASGTDFFIGLSSRSGRLVEADRLMFEAAEALNKAKEDPESPIMGFRSDPEKYRKFLSEH